MKLSILLSFIFSCVLLSYGQDKPNIIIFLLDDVGAESCHPYGCDTNVTPNMDFLADNGIRFASMNAYAKCGPTRAALMTGRESNRNGVTTAVGANLSLDEITLAEVAKANGYATHACGKWNLNKSSTTGLTAQESALAQGFDTALIPASGIAPPDWDQWHPDYDPDLESRGEESYWDWQYMDSATNFITSNSGGPFFLYYSFALPHGSWTGTPITPVIKPTDTEGFYDELVYADNSVSNIMAVLESEGILENTLILLIGDNGTPAGIYSSYNGTLIEGGKAQDVSTGTWVPMYAYWKGTTPLGAVYDGLTQLTDVSATIMELVGGPIPTDRVIDGRSFADKLTDPTGDHGRHHIFIGQSAGGYCTQDAKYRYINFSGAETFRDISNRPYGDVDIDTNNLSQVELISLMKLESILANEWDLNDLNMSPFGRSANEVVFSTRGQGPIDSYAVYTSDGYAVYLSDGFQLYIGE